jgi:uncharacterized Zn finger protein
MARYGDFPEYVPAAEKRRRVQAEIAKRKKRGETITPIAIDGKKIAATFWGASWCAHLEGYSDYENRLPRGRAYVRNGSVLHLASAEGRVDALVQGSELYEVAVTIAPLAAPRWKAIVDASAGAIDSLVELLQGKLSSGVMKVVTDRATGLFPGPRDIRLKCSCPDYASMCKHVAAVLYGVGARLDTEPELLFVLRKVNHLDLMASATKAEPVAARRSGKKVIAEADLGGVFGIDLVASPVAPARKVASKPVSKKAAKRATRG